MIRLTRCYRFSAAHRLHSGGLSGEENAAVYGKCNHPHGHGHDYLLEVSVTGPLDPATGLVARVEALDRLVERQVLNRLRHRDLNTEVPELEGLPPTTELLAAAVIRMLQERWQEAFPAGHPRLDRVRLHETRKNIFEAFCSI
jgi:6-pyruvoyltetrahydropterin/6-carboxytetrahydropterin synthase